jgi:ABC-type amino acid transport substrate-binding protein
MVLFFLTASAELYAEKLILRYPRPESLKDVRHIYRFELLKLAMDRTKAVYGDFEIVYTAAEMTQSRALTELENNGVVDVIALPSNVEREKKFLPVRIPVMKGILGYRIFIINKDQKDRFRKIKKLSDLKKLKAGAGHDWADVQILEKNGIDVERGGKYEGLFFMLAAGRFDYFPRGVNEAKKEIEDRQGTLPDLMIEETLALYYPFPVYFFVNKNNPELARRIEAGLNYAINDGSFELLFSRYFKAYLADADLKNRKIFRLKNPFLPAETPYKNRSLWYNIDR